MQDSTDVIPIPWRPASLLGRGIRFALLLVALAGACRSPMARAETVDVACSASALASGIGTANVDGEEDLVRRRPRTAGTAAPAS
jgi:hypothetical protein